MSVTSEIQAAARAIRTQQKPDATFHLAAAVLLDRIALSTPDSVIESQAGALVRDALAVARAYRSPGTSPRGGGLRGGQVAEGAGGGLPTAAARPRKTSLAVTR